jgi:hypothetical protein
MGGMTVAGLRRERDRNRLVIEKIAGKEFTTLAHIERMRAATKQGAARAQALTDPAFFQRSACRPDVKALVISLRSSSRSHLPERLHV